jgi:carbonic anhydrase
MSENIMKNIYKNIFLKPFFIVLSIFFSGTVFAQAGDAELSQSLADKIKKGGGDIVMRPSDLKEIVPSKTVVKPVVQSTAISTPSKNNSVGKDSMSHHHWSYETRETGPENWGKLSKENALCTNGKQQSPINIEKGIQVDLPALSFDYKPSQLAIEDNGHTIIVKYSEGSNLSVQGKQYRLAQFHFHHPSEEMVDGKRFDMVVHLVHQHFDGSLLVLAVFMNADKNSATLAVNHHEEGLESKVNPQKSKQESNTPVSNFENPLFQQILNNIPLIKNVSETPSGVMIDINHFLPKSLAYYTYMGSLTTPPCTENITWIVLKEPITLTRQQVENFGLIYSNNARPIQPKHDRLIKATR